ncbi:short-chain dehydrogenase/reductase [Streptomyces sp. 549]|uniref:short-chain dehydrogenase/reductase n=1 Tax=Streptomyces sp. 549 TaxID=3049076 RepID=UPI0024C411E7|nr:short-chain dehydrogenase/reductase [Streptomyces sp. 549]MDK1475839.1 short-chain dehydrogenase/reductase [Streptomyces sp. 549]
MRTRSPLRGRTTVVTGAARGVGEAVARRLTERGARVALLGLEGDRLDRLAGDLGGRAAAWTVDVTDQQAMARTADLVRERLGPVSVVVVNAGVAAGGPLLHTDPALWRRVVEVNLVGSAVTARVFLPDLLRTRGYLLQVASLAALAPAPMMTAYCASKSGAEAFAHALRAEVRHLGVGVGVGYLSWTDTAMIRAADHSPALRELRDAMPWPASRTHPVGPAAARLVGGIERRAETVHTPPWLRAVAAARVVVPGLVARGAAREFRRRAPRFDLPDTGPLGAGGRAAVGRPASEPPATPS